MDLEEIRKIVETHGYQKASLIAILQDVQSKMNYLPRKALLQISKSLDVPPARVYEVATFYKAFSLVPRGKHTLRVCLGTACHVRGGARVLDTVESLLGVKAGKTTPDLSFTLETVNCLGACALGPVLVIDDRVYGRIRMDKIESILKKYR